MKKPHFKKIVIAGIGLMGGSLGLAVKKAKLADIVVGWARRERTIRQARAKKCIDKGTLCLASAVQEADLIVLAGPVRSTPALLQAMLPYLSPGCLVTDVGSTKAELLEEIEDLITAAAKEKDYRRKPDFTFIGSHPMAGSEKSGVNAARHDLYENSLCLLIKSSHTPRTALSRLKKFWQAVGCKRVDIVSPREHDRFTAMVSHLPHLVAVCLVNQLADLSRQDPRIRGVAATGFRDTTRVAAGLPGMWLDILLTNQKEICSVIDEFQLRLAGIKKMLKNQKEPDLIRELEEARDFRLDMESKSKCRKK